MKKAFILSMDAIIAASIITVVVIFMTSLSFSYSSPEISYKRLYSSGKDAIAVMENAKVSSIYDMLDSDYITDCAITASEMNRTIVDMVGYFWSQGQSECAENLTRFIYENAFPGTRIGFGVFIDNSLIYNTTMLSPDYISRVSTVVSGYEKEKVVRGFISKVYLAKISKTSTIYSYFGGYVGDGNITKTITLPSDVNITECYFEADTGNNFTLYINGHNSGNYFPKTSNMSADRFIICNTSYQYDFCQNITEGQNVFEVNFTTINDNYIGGGYFRIKYKTSEFLESELQSGDTVSKRQYLPGIRGLINLYSSFYVPGTINNMSVYLRYKNNLSINEEGIPVYFVIGNREVYRENSTGFFNVTINDSVLSGHLNYSNTSGTTIPIRFGTETFLFSFGIGRSDSVLITDRSGSMDGCDVDTTACIHTDCSGDTGCQNRRLEIAKDVDKVFVDTMLNVSGNRVGLNGYGTCTCSAYPISNDSTALTSRIDTYDYDCGCTCISCGLIKAMQSIITEGIEISVVSRESGWLYNTSYPLNEPDLDENGSTWYNRTYNDTGWGSGEAIMGFENSPYSPSVNEDIGNNNGNYYFRKHFNITDVSDIGSAEVFVLADDAAEIYLNGNLIFNDTFNHLAEYWNRGGVLFEDDFESGNLDKWVIDSNNDGGVAAIDNEPYEGSYNAKFYGDGSSPNNIWVRKDINVSGRDNISFTYMWATEDLENGYQGYLDIYDGSWHNAVKGYALNNGRTQNPDYTTTSYQYAWEDIDLDDYAKTGNLSIRFRCTARYAERYDTFLIDDVMVREHVYINTSYFRNGDNVIAVKLRNDDSDSAKFDLELNYTQNRYKAIAVMSDGGANTIVSGEDCQYSSGSENPAKAQVIDFSCEARDRYGIVIYGIAFGDGAYPDTLKKAACWNCSSNDWIEGEGEDNCSRFFQSSNAEELVSIYNSIASDIANATYKAQTIQAAGNISLDNILYPDSYLEFNYTPYSRQLSYGEITINYESKTLGECSGQSLITDNSTGTKEGWFSIPPNSTILEAKVTSYSSNYWTDRLWVNSSNTPNQNWTRAYWLGNFSDDYETLGDPYTINIPVEYLSSGGNNSVRIGTGLVPENGTGASPDDRTIFAISIGGIGLVGYSGVFPKLNGTTVTIWSDLDGDNIADKSFVVEVGPNPSDVFDPMNDSIDDAFMRLIDKLNFIYDSNPDGYGNGTASNPYDGVNQTNPIDIEITSDISFNSNYISNVPSLWGPAILEVRTWI
ncbi:MAG: hypothetical protein JW716_01765 [Candidatus Aenigmarchaeota archaeon]|nr:hypothetical protein [Candidatus Aenigmarchaeota archaeon]